MRRRDVLLGTAALTAATLLPAGPAAATPTMPGATPTGPAATPALVSPADWMSAINGGTPLWKLTIPGTHDTGALYGGPAAQCQTQSVTAQLEAGVRFLDVRCRATGGSFAIHHGPVYQNLMFGDVLVSCWNFLAAHPGETVLMRVKQEYSTVSDAEFGAIFTDYLDRRGWRSLFRLDDGLPALGDVRGRVQLIGDNGGIGGIRWAGPLMDLQDAWDVPTIFHREQKWQKVAAQLDRAAANTAPRLFVNFASGSSAFCYPDAVASYVAPRLRDRVAAMAGRTPLGVVVTDLADRFAPTLPGLLSARNA
ncbi:phosphatidylinositol-specific phospholipase C [Longispora sp. K20-0274]|uniref:phosphatidylinositol-specific phospholipase C n=1 Tax=Longispora sp. K20-0274 TaxID=3088255 RepID=UPI003999B580